MAFLPYFYLHDSRTSTMTASERQQHCRHGYRCALRLLPSGHAPANSPAMILSWPQPGSHAAVPAGIARGGATGLDAPDVAPRRDGGLDGKGAAALASGFDEAVGDDPLGLVGAGRVGKAQGVVADGLIEAGGKHGRPVST